MILSALVQAGNECLFCRFGDGCGGNTDKAGSLTARGLQYVLSPKLVQILGFLAGGTGVSEVLVQMGRLRGNIAKNTKSLLHRDCNMFLPTKLGQILGF
ncbi:MAG: hypothetical protein AN484_17900 [Aphanizomenon flos-aquae WA102]|uniref:Uncharacterized protein n=1 Tax=Aphanizomenon flos-aquae WA102 TaxID=1710896 RepID=A0A1B7WZ97_APHFL|nr:MAG: hypothetical protein AN484_17900 [Aphanizomenon flos-aquae WA102]